MDANGPYCNKKALHSPELPAHLERMRGAYKPETISTVHLLVRPVHDGMRACVGGWLSGSGDGARLRCGVCVRARACL